MDIKDLLCINATDKHSGVGNYAMMIEELLGKGKVATLVMDKRKSSWDYPGKVYNGFFPPVTSGWKINSKFYRTVFRIKGLAIPNFVHLLDVMALMPDKRQRGIVTVHDLYHDRRSYSSNEEGRKFLEKLINRLLNWEYILSDSHATKEELLQLGFREDRISVIHLALRDGIWFRMGEKELETALKQYFPSLQEVNKPIVLTVGDATQKHNDLTNQAAGEDYFHIHVGKDVKADLNVQGIPDEQLRILFNIASVYVRPTDFEGFGLPAIEALMCGTPSVVSDIPVYHETLGNSGVYAEVDKASVAEKIGYAIDHRIDLIRAFDTSRRDYYSIKRFNAEMLDYYGKVTP